MLTYTYVRQMETEHSAPIPDHQIQIENFLQIYNGTIL